MEYFYNNVCLVYNLIPFLLKSGFQLSKLKFFFPNNEIKKIIMETATKTYSLDPIPIDLLKECIDTLIKINYTNNKQITFIRNFPNSWKEALVTPLLKKDNLYQIYKNYRPI